MEFLLTPHPTGLPTIDLSVRAKVERVGDEKLQFQFVVEGAVGLIEYPEWTPARRADGLWRQTCYEAFVSPVGRSDYLELNFIGLQWAAYIFDDYRQGMREAPVVPIAETFGEMYGTDLQNAVVDLGPLGDEAFAGMLDVALTAVIEQTDGTKSYWALAHPPGDKPDFHHRDCFVARLA